jgi:hypothetical protein
MMIMAYLIMIMAEINTNAATFINTLSRRQCRDRKITDLGACGGPGASITTAFVVGATGIPAQRPNP